MTDDVQPDESKHLATHVAVCSVRYVGINARLRRLERFVWLGIAAVISLQGWIIKLLLERSDLPFWPH